MNYFNCYFKICRNVGIAEPLQEFFVYADLEKSLVDALQFLHFYKLGGLREFLRTWLGTGAWLADLSLVLTS